MPPKAKHPTPSAPLLHERMTKTWRTHPVVTLSTLAAVVGLLVSIWPAFTWLSSHYQTSEQAHAMEVRIQRSMAWAAVADARRDSVVARNRVNDCDIKREKRESLTPLESAACAQYADDLRTSQAAFDKAVTYAKESSKE